MDRAGVLMRVALLHLDLGNGPEERNLAMLYKSISLAAEQGAQWIITPETAVQGYFSVSKIRRRQFPCSPALPCGRSGNWRRIIN